MLRYKCKFLQKSSEKVEYIIGAIRSYRKYKVVYLNSQGLRTEASSQRSGVPSGLCNHASNTAT